MIDRISTWQRKERQRAFAREFVIPFLLSNRTDGLMASGINQDVQDSLASGIPDRIPAVRPRGEYSRWGERPLLYLQYDGIDRRGVTEQQEDGNTTGGPS